jgi:hypothetical protein
MKMGLLRWLSNMAHDGYHNNVSEADLLQMTRALAKFFREHDGLAMPFLEEIAAFLEAGRFDDAAKKFKQNSPSHHGPFDWFPPAKFENEDGDYVQAVFESLVERWSRLWQAATARPRCR